jgi:hypothetical protein
MRLSFLGTFRWSGGRDNGLLINNFTNWASGQPDNLNNEDCVLRWSDGTWNDNSCSPTFSSIMEFECAPGYEFGPTSCTGLKRSLRLS